MEKCIVCNDDLLKDSGVRTCLKCKKKFCSFCRGEDKNICYNCLPYLLLAKNIK